MSTSSEPQRVPEPQRRKKRRSAASRVIVWLILLFLLISVAVAAGAFYAFQEYALPGPLAQNKIVTIGKGSGAPEIAAQLESEGVISSAGVFSAMAHIKGTRTSLKPGEYEFAAAASMRDVMTQIANGRSITYKLSVPEGWTTEMAMDRIRANEVLTGDIVSVPAEGAIMPDTYVFKRGMTRQDLVDAMVAAQVKLLDELWMARSPTLDLKSKEEAVILASIVEKETAKADERPVIASVFVNRLNKNMRLQSDPTIIYGIVGGKGKLGRELTREDIRTPTPYNTYTINGLPPGPIANPGRAALEAVLNPPESQYLYFVADGSGGHAFAVTLDEHNKNVENWRKLAKDAISAAAEVVEEEPPAAATPPEQTLPAIETVPQLAPPPADEAEPIESQPVTGTVPPASPQAQAEPQTGAAAPEPVPAPKPEPQDQAATPPEPAPVAPEPVAPETVAEAQPEPPPPPKPTAAPKPGSVVKVDGKLTIIPRPKPAN